MSQKYTPQGLEAKVDDLDLKITSIGTTLASIDKTLDRNTNSLSEHMKRTSMLEARVKPIEDHVNGLNFILKAAGVVSLGLGIIAGVITVVKFLL